MVKAVVDVKLSQLQHRIKESQKLNIPFEMKKDLLKKLFISLCQRIVEIGG